jgi:microcystin-dependent protein
MAVGAVGDRIKIAKAVADGSVEPRYMLGVTFETIANGAEGYVTLIGEIPHLDTDAYTVGTVLWIDPNTPGAFTTTEPVAPDIAIAAAIVTRKQASSGRIFVRMYSQQTGLHELHDVLLTNPLDKQVLKYDAASSLWVNGVASGGVTTGATPPASPNAGDAWYDTTDGLLYIWYVDADSSQWVEVKANSALETTLLTRVATLEANQTPSGVIMQFAGVTAPAGYLLCDGTAVSRTTYAGLFTAISTTYGVGDNSTTFNLPDLRGRVPVGRHTSDSSFDVLGETGGAKTHTLTVAEMPSHSHPAAYYDGPEGTPISNRARLVAGISLVTDTSRIGNTGGGQAHNNLQPYIVTNYIIKT